MSLSTYRKSVLPSGLTVVSEALPDRASISAGVWVRHGGRDEPAERLGISHFIEHMTFKGTERRDARALAESLESLGGHLDAFTAREQTCYYARALAEHLPETLDVLADLVSRPRFAPEDVEKEKDVVREEIASCEDDPEDKASEVLARLVWRGHALGLPILGTFDTVGAFDRETLRAYFASRYRAPDLVVAAAGALEHERLVDLAQRHFAPPAGPEVAGSGPPPAFRPAVEHEVREDLQQTYLALGTRGVAWGDPRRWALAVLNTLLGGGMSSRLFQRVREEEGLAYSIYSACDYHHDAGMLSIHLGVSPERARDALRLVRDELARLAAEGPGEAEVAAARAQLRGGIVLGQESVSTRMSHLAHEELYSDGYQGAEEQVRAVLAVTREQVAEAARTWLAPGGFAVAAVGPATGGALGAADWPAA
jgi:predicted Zn-dependent peptidase